MRIRRLAAILCALMLAAGLGARAERVTAAQRALEEQGTRAFWALVAGDCRWKPEEADCARVSVQSPDSPVRPTIDDTYAPQYLYRVRLQENGGVGFTIDRVDSYVYLPGDDAFLFDRPANLSSGTYLPAYGAMELSCGDPWVNPLLRVVVVSGVDDAGHELEFYGIVECVDYLEKVEQDLTYDSQNLRRGAVFEVPAADDVWWVPAVSLGDTRYTNAEIAAMAAESPEEKQRKLATLYEAVQMFQISGFAEADDNVRIRENGVNWEHHKPGFHAVRTNEGCCASDANWLNYILHGDYDEVGFLAWSRTDGSGHIINYIRSRGDWYFIDLTHYRADSFGMGAPETGRMSDYRQSDFVTGNLHRAASPEAYVRYCLESFNDPPGLFFLYQAEDCKPLDGIFENGGVCVVYPDDFAVTVVYDDPDDKLTYRFVSPPRKTYDWAALPTAAFHVDEVYTAASGTAGASHAVGDVLSLKDEGERGFAVVDGETYASCDGTRFLASFKAEMRLYGGNFGSYTDVTFPLEVHGAECEGLESVRLGNMLMSVTRRATDVEMLYCVREGDALRVTDVFTGEHEFLEPMRLVRAEDGAWQGTEEYWYLVRYRAEDGEHAEFARFRCGVE